MSDPFQPGPGWLDRANRLALLARVLSGTVHDVNNALQVISGSAELLLMAPGAPDMVRTRGQAIGNQARRASQLLAELTAFARDQRDQAGPVALRAVVDQAVTLRRYALTKMQAAIEIEGDDQTVTASPRHVLQIVLNLIVNAERAMAGAASPRLVIRLAHEGAMATVSVEDNGAGVAPAEAARLFEARGPAPDAGGDLGIGLAVSQWMAAQAGGRVTYAAAAGGSRFTLALPA